MQHTPRTADEIETAAAAHGRPPLTTFAQALGSARQASTPPTLGVWVGDPGMIGRLGVEDCAHALLVVAYGGAPVPPELGGLPVASVPNRVLGGAPSVEIWWSSFFARRIERGTLCASENGRVLLGRSARRVDVRPEEATEGLFSEVLEQTVALGYPYLLRVWNYLPGINNESDGQEHYRRFNVGRARAFDERFGRTDAERRFPASSTVGTSGVELVTYFAATREPSHFLENPRQVAAYRYPAVHGATSPSFSRAARAPQALGSGLFLSGTASVVGHESRHAGAVDRQIEETLANLEVLLRSTARAGHGVPPSLPAFDLLKVYVRRSEDLETVRAALGPVVGGAPVIYLEADLCRSELLVEIEGTLLSPPRWAE